MTPRDAPFHAHIYYAAGERDAAVALRAALPGMPGILFVGRMADGPVGPHPLPQFEVHFHEPAVEAVVAAIADAGLRGLAHRLTADDGADHTSPAQGSGEPVALDLGTLDPPG